MYCVRAPLNHAIVITGARNKSRLPDWDFLSSRKKNRTWATKATPKSKSEEFYGVLRIRYGRVTLVDAGEYAQVCCGAMYLDCIADGPPLVFDALISGSNVWMVTMDFVPLFEDMDYYESYISGLSKIQAKHNHILHAFPESFFANKRWTSSKLVFSSGNWQKGEEGMLFAELLRLLRDVVEHYLDVAYGSWESSRGKHPPGIVLEKQLAFLEWMETHQHPSSLLIQSHFGIGWFDLVLKSLWKDTHGLSRWGGPLQTRAAYHEIYEDALKEAKGNVQEANEKLIATGLQPLEYLYFNPNPDMWDIDDI